MKNFKRKEFDTREWSTEKIEKLCKKLKSEGYVFEERESKGLSSISAWEDGTYRLYDKYLACKDLLTTYEEYMGEEYREPMREVVLIHNTVSIGNVNNQKLYGVFGEMDKTIIYQVKGIYTYSFLGALSCNKSFTFNTLEEVIKFCISKGWRVLEFDNSEDLLRWLLEK
jgi:hypothetical protein